MPLDDTIIVELVKALIFFESCIVRSKWKFGHFSGDPYFSISALVCGVNSSVYFRKICTALMAIGLSTCTGTLRNLARFHELFQQEEEFLRALHGE